MADFQRGRRGIQFALPMVPPPDPYELADSDFSYGRFKNAQFVNTVNALLGAGTAQHLPTSGTLGVLESPLDETGRTRKVTSSALLKHLASRQAALDKKTSTSRSGSNIKTFAEMAAEGSASDKVLKALEQNTRAQQRATIGKKPDKGFLGDLGDLIKVPATVALKGGLKALEYLNRPLQAIEVPLKDRIEAYNQTGDLGDLFDVGKGLGESYRGLTGKERTSGGEVFSVAGAPSPVAGLAGFGLDVVADPISWVSFGSTAIGKKTAEIAAEAGLSQAEHSLLEKGLQNVERVTKGGATRGVKRLTEAELDSAFADVLRQRMDDFAASKGAQIEKDILNAGGSVDEAAAKTFEAGEQEAQRLRGLLHDAAKPLTQNRLQFRVGFLGHGPDVLAKSELGQRIGEAAWKPLARTNEALSKTGAGNAMKNLFNHEHNFSGRTQAIRDRALGVGTQIHDQFVKDVLEQYKYVPRDMQERIFDAIEQGYSLSGQYAPDGQSLEDLRQQAIKFFQDKGQEAIDLGLLKGGDLVDRYAYHAYPVGRLGKYRDAAKNFRAARRAILADPNVTEVPANLTARAAQAEGLRPKTNILDSMIEYSARHERDIARKMTVEDTVNVYGHLGPAIGAPSKLGLKAVKLDNLTPDLIEMAQKAAVQATGNPDASPFVWYLPEKINDVFSKFFDITQTQNIDELNKVMRGVDAMNRWFKFSRTVPRPTYHVNNMITDAFMGYLDDIPTKEYYDVMKRYTQGRSGQLVDKVELAPGHSFDFNQLVDEFRRSSAGANFFHTELPLGETLPGGRGVGEVVRSAAGKARKFSEMREDFGRYVHYQGALKQEFAKEIENKGIQAGTVEAERAFKKAAQRAAERTSYSKVNFSALTPFEVKYARRIVPFYTFARKAMPVMLAAIARQPGRIQVPYKAMNAIATMLGTEPHNGEFDPRRIPDYLRDTGTFLRLSGGNEPFFLNMSSAMPTSTLLNPLGLEDVTQKNAFLAAVTKLNPALTAPVEIGLGRNLFTNQPVNGVADWAVNKLNPVDWLTKQAEQGPSGALRNVLIEQLPTERQLASVKQDTRKYTATNAILNDLLTAKGLEIQSSKTKQGQKWRLIDRIQGRVIGTFNSPAEAQAFADSIG